MKKMMIAGILMLLCLMPAQAQTAKDFLKKYGEFVEQVNKKKEIKEMEVAALDSTFNKFTQEYHNTYKAKMTNEEVETYTKYRTTYLKKMAVFHTRKVADMVAEQADTVGRKVLKGAKKVGAKVGGFIKGVLGTDK